MDILFWKNITEDLDGDPQLIERNVKIEQFNKVYDEVSLFHYFADNQEVLEFVNQRFRQKSDAGLLNQVESNMPMVMLTPDCDGKTSVDRAIE